MRSSASPSRRVILATGIAALLGVAVHSGHAATLNWEPDGVVGAPTGGSGAWDTTSLFWDNAGTLQAWTNATNDTAVFGNSGIVSAPPYTVTLGAPITAGALAFNASNYTVTGNTLTLAGATPTLTVANAGDIARINSIIAGSTGLTTAGSGTLILGGANTFTGVMTIGTGSYVGLTSATALGSNASGNYTNVLSGGTLNIGGQTVNNAPAPTTPGEEIRIAGTGVGGVGAIVNTNGTGTNTLAKVTLTANATISAGGSTPVSYNAGGGIATGVGGRIDVRLSAAPTAAQKHLDLAGFTLTKTGGHLLAIVNADVSDGDIVVNEGQLNFESGSLLNGSGTVTVNQNGKLGFWSISNAANITRPIVVNGGTFGDPTSTGASQTVNSPVQIKGALNPNFVAAATGFTTTLAGQITKDSTSTITELSKRGLGNLALSNTANSFDVPVTIYAGNLQANYNTAFTGGVAPAAPVALTDTPLGTVSTLKLAGGTLNIRVNGAGDTSNQVFTIGKSITVDLAPSGINLGLLSGTTSTDKNLSLPSLTFAPSSAANGWSIGQNQLTMTQNNAYRLQLAGTTMNNDTVLNVGDYTFTGNTTSANKNTMIHTGGNSFGFVGGTHDFNAFFSVGNAQMRVGSMYGTGVTSNTATAGSGTIYSGPNNAVSFRTPTNIAAGQTIEVLSQRGTQSAVNFEQFTTVPSSLRAAGSGMIGVGGASAFGNIDLARVGDGTFRVGVGIAGAANGTITGVVSPGAGNLVRLGGLGTSTLTLSAANSVTGNAGLEVGSDLINGGFRTTQSSTAQNGVVILSGANNYTGGTTVNRGATLRFQNSTPGTGAINAFGTITAEGATGTFINAGSNLPVSIYGGSTLRFDSSALTTGLDVDRWQDSTAIALNNATLQLDARANNSVSNETVGAISYAGGSTISLQRNNGAAATSVVQLQTPSLTRANNGTLEVTRAGSSGFGATVKLLATSAPTVTNGMVTPTINTLDVTSFTNFATFDANGINNAALTGTVTTGATAGTLDTGLSATGIYYLDFATANTTLTLGDNPTVYALKVGGGTGTTSLASSGANNTITLRSGGLIFSAHNGGFSTDGTRTINVAPSLVANDGTSNIEAVINTRNGYTANLNGTVTANGLTKFGAGTLNLSANNTTTLSGNVYVNQGTLQAFGPTATSIYDPLGKGLVTLAGGQLNLRSNNTAVTGTINPTLENGLSVAQNIPIATLDVGRSGADSASSGTFIFNPATAGSTGLQLLGSPGVQGQTLTVSGSNYGVQFGDNAVNTLAGNVTINNAVTLRLSNPPTTTGTNPIVTKSGGGSLIIGNDNSTVNGTAAAGTQVVVNAGTLDLRTLGAFGTGATTSLVLNAGTLNLRRDTAGVFGVAGTPYPTIVNGNSTISVDRLGTTQSAVSLGLGKLTLNNDATLTVANGNTYGLDFTGAQINGNGFINANMGQASNVDVGLKFLAGSAVAGGSLVKTGGGVLHLLNPNNTFDGGLYAQAGITRLRATGTAGTGTVSLNPGAIIDFNSASNLNAGQKLVLHSNSSFLSMVSVNVNGVTHPTGANIEFSANETGIIGLSNGNTVYNNAIDLSQLYGGRWSLGGVPQGVYDPKYTAATLGAGADNLYRLGGGGTSFFISISDTAGTPRNNVLTGSNSVRYGFDSGNLLGANGTNFRYDVGGTQNYTGNTVIHRGMIVRSGSAADSVTSNSVFSSGTVDVFGILALVGQSTLQANGSATNNLTLHPGSTLSLDNNTGLGNVGASNVGNRIADGQAISLNGAMIELVGNNNATTTETLGATTFSAGARLRVARAGTGSATLTLTSLAESGAKGNQLLIQPGTAGQLGVSEKIVVNSGAPTPSNGMVNARFVNTTENTFVTYGANGFANISSYDKTLNATYTAGSLLATDKVDVGTAALTLQDNPTVYALRTNQSINVGGPFNQITIRSGGLINYGNATTVTPNLVFNDGAQNVEARIYASTNLTLNGSITADGVVKSGSGQLIVNVPQPTFAGGWVVNSGDVIFNDAGAAGQSVTSNAITVNATQTTSGQITQTLNRSRVVFQRDNGTPELLTFSGGPIKIVNEGDIAVIAANDRQTQIPNVTTESTGTGASAALSLDVRSNRFRAVIPTLTLNSDTTARVYDSTNGNNGAWTNASVASLVGAGKTLNKIGNRTLELTGDNSATFTGGTINVAAGTLRVANSNALGSATSKTNIERNAALEIAVANFSPSGALTQQPGSIERWNVEDARGTANYSVPTGVNLQLNTNLVSASPRTITLNGGSLEGFIYTDSVAQVDQRTVGAAVTLNLGADSFVGQNILLGQGYEAGRGPTVAQPFGDAYTGSFLRIEGKITGSGNLTKTGLDTVTIASTGNTYGNTSVDMGVLRIAANNALPTNKTLTTRLGGTFDMYGSDQEVAGLGVADNATSPGGVSVGSSGRIINSAPYDNVLKVNNRANFTYNGTIERTLAVTKSGTGTLTLGGSNTYVGVTTVESGTLAVTGSIAGSQSVRVMNGATLAGNGALGLALDISGVIAPGVGNVGALNTPGLADFKTGSTLSLEIGSAASSDKLTAGSVSLTGTVTLSLSLVNGFSPANNTSFTLLDNTGAGSFAGLFSAPGSGTVLTEGSVLSVGAQQFSISYQGGTGNDLVVTAVPEPGMAASILGGIGLLLGFQRRRTNRKGV